VTSSLHPWGPTPPEHFPAGYDFREVHGKFSIVVWHNNQFDDDDGEGSIGRATLAAECSGAAVDAASSRFMGILKSVGRVHHSPPTSPTKGESSGTLPKGAPPDDEHFPALGCDVRAAVRGARVGSGSGGSRGSGASKGLSGVSYSGGAPFPATSGASAAPVRRKQRQNGRGRRALRQACDEIDEVRTLHALSFLTPRILSGTRVLTFLILTSTPPCICTYRGTDGVCLGAISVSVARRGRR